MKRHLALCGKWLGGAGGGGALAYLIATVAAGGRHAVWPYGLCGAILLVGLIMYFTCQDRPKAQTPLPGVSAEPEDQPSHVPDQEAWAWTPPETETGVAAEQAPARSAELVADRWLYTADGFKAHPLMNMASYAMPGYLGSREASPFMRIGVCVACAPIDSSSLDSSNLRRDLTQWLRRAPVSTLIEKLTHLPADWDWVAQVGRGALRVEAILGDGEEPAASAMLHLPLLDLRSAGRSDDMACLWLQILPRGEGGEIAQSAGLSSWYWRFLRILSLTGAFAEFLRDDLGMDVSGHPAARVGVMLQAKSSMTDLVDPQGLPTLPGASSSTQFLGYAIVDVEGKPSRETPCDFLKQLCDYDLQVDASATLLRSMSALPELGSTVLVLWRGAAVESTVISTLPSETDPRVIVNIPQEDTQTIRHDFRAEAVQGVD